MSQVFLGQEIQTWAESHGIPVRYLETCESTNDLAKAEAFSPDLKNTPFLIYLTDLQTKGRGRNQHSWLCPKPGQQLLMTWSFQLAEVPQPTLSPRIGLALWNAVSTTWASLPWGLKPPNDLYLGDRKVAGILLENVLQGQSNVRTLIGIGMNILSTPESLPSATSIMESLPAGSPLLSEDIFCFLDRLSLEITQAVSVGTEVLSTTDQANLIWALNKFSENSKEGPASRYTQIDENGTLWQGPRRISWTEL